MSLIKREPSPRQSLASRANSRRSTGPRSAQGKALASRNLPKARLYSKLIAHCMAVLDESPQEFERMHRALSDAMEPRDGWEAAWVQDIAILRWRLERLHRAEVGVVALRRRRRDYQRHWANRPPAGAAALEINGLASNWGFTGLPDSPLKFQQVIAIFTLLRNIVTAELFEDGLDKIFALLYGHAPGPDAAVLKVRFESVAKLCKEVDSEASLAARRSLVDDLNKEIAEWEQLQALYTAEHVDANPLQQDAELLLPTQEMDQIIRYETHLENQIERKLRRFYARRREAVPCCQEIAGEVLDAPTPCDLAGALGEDDEVLGGMRGSFNLTLCPVENSPPKAEKLLKTKGPERRFSTAKAESMLKNKGVTESCGKLDIL